ncbi:hypothetical protein BH11ARM1_BH11ARM1_10830 [soil metagenome]
MNLRQLLSPKTGSYSLFGALVLGACIAPSLASAQTSWGNRYIFDQMPSNIHGIKQISVNSNNGALVQPNGKVICWGEGDDGQTNVPAGLKAKKVSFGNYFVAALTTDRKLVFWGNGYSGQFDAPSNLAPVLDVAASTNVTVAILTDGTVTGWGNNGQPGIPAGITGGKQVDAFFDNFAVLKHNGVVVTWMQGDPAQYMTGLHAKQISVGAGHYMALRNDGTVACWGQNASGQCDVPSGLDHVVKVQAGAYFSTALKDDGTVVCWGDNDQGECDVPAGLTGVTSLAVSSEGVFAIRGMTLSLAPQTLMAGQTGLGTVSLATVAPIGGTTVDLSSSDPLVTVPGTVFVPEGSKSTSFEVTADVSASSTVTVTAVNGLYEAEADVEIASPSVNFTSLNYRVTGTGNQYSGTSGTVSIPYPAGPNGVAVSMSATAPIHFSSSTVTIPQGATSAHFYIYADVATVTAHGTITADISGATATATVTVLPIKALITVSGTPLHNNQFATVTVTLTKAPTTDIQLTVFSSNSSWAEITPFRITIPAGQTVGTCSLDLQQATHAWDLEITVKSNDVYVGSRILHVNL